MKRGNNYLQQLQKRRQEAAATESKPISEMSEEELDREIEQARLALRDIKEREVAAARQVRQEQVSGSKLIFAGRSKKRRWK